MPLLIGAAAWRLAAPRLAENHIPMKTADTFVGFIGTVSQLSPFLSCCCRCLMVVVVVVVGIASTFGY